MGTKLVSGILTIVWSIEIGKHDKSPIFKNKL